MYLCNCYFIVEKIQCILIPSQFLQEPCDVLVERTGCNIMFLFYGHVEFWVDSLACPTASKLGAGLKVRLEGQKLVP